MLQIRAMGVLLCASLSTLGVGEEVVPGPPSMMVDARIDDSGPGGEKRFSGTVLTWEESRQSWNQSGSASDDGRSIRASRVRSRAVLVLQAKEFVASLGTLRFSDLRGKRLDESELAELLKNKRAVAFINKGSTIHPEIASSLHPDTVVVTRFSYPNPPVLIDLPTPK